jgi:hypothetical protein
MNYIKASISCAYLVLTGVCFAQGDAGQPDRPSFAASQTSTVTATVTAIDHETREVTLERSDGEIVKLTAGPDVRNLDQVGVGDVVYAEFSEAVTIAVSPDDGASPEMLTDTNTARAPEGGMPGVAVVGSTVVTAIVEAIDLENGTFRLREPDGEIREYAARNPQNLERAAVGDRVIITTRESLVITVSKQALN